MTHGDKRFDELSNEEKKKIIDRELSKFRNAMIYSFNKGHQMGFPLLLVHTGYKMLENTDLKLSVFQHFFILVSY